MNYTSSDGDEKPRGFFTVTETESDDMDIQAAIKLQKSQLEKHKAKGSDAGKKNNKNKRIIVGLLVGATFMLAISAGPLYFILLMHLIAINMFNELSSIQRRADKDNLNAFSGPWLEWVLLFLCNYYVTPKRTLRPGLLENSGITALDYPLVHALLYTYKLPICLFISCIVVISFTFSLQRGAFRYQYQRFGFSIICAVFCAMVANSLGGLILFGTGWAFFVPFIVACNDSSAYFCGVTMGHTPLITLSPNKTMEGFVGGAILTLIATFFAVEIFLSDPQMVCPVNQLSFLPFAPTKCLEQYAPQIAEKQVFSLPFSFMGLQAVMLSQVQIACMFFGLLASIVTPFGGFMASGIKRAYQLKDFADTLPGHGGFVDRFDCITCMALFAFLYLDQIVYRNVFLLDDALARISATFSLDDTAKLMYLIDNQLIQSNQ